MNKTTKNFVFCLALFLPLLTSAATVATRIDDDVGASIVKCFHPTAAYESIDDMYFPTPSNDSYDQVDGKVRFRGGFTGNPYYMKFTFYARLNNGKLQFRIEPGMDTAPFPPNPSCRFRDWTSI